MTDIKVIDERKVLDKDFRIYGDFDNPLFLAKDVAGWIGHSNVTDMISRVDEHEVTKLNLGGLQGECNFLTEDGLYEVLMQSRKPIAKKFKKEVKQILKSIRKHGAYITENTLEQMLLSPDFGIKLLTELKKEQEARRGLELKVEQDKPKVEFAEAVQRTESTMLMRDLAKLLKQNGIDTGEKRLYSWMRENGFICKTNRMPTQKSMNNDLMVIHVTTVEVDGKDIENKVTRITGEGQRYFINRFLKEKARVM